MHIRNNNNDCHDNDCNHINNTVVYSALHFHLSEQI